jgi:phage-related protein
MFDGYDACWVPNIPTGDDSKWRIRASQFSEGYEHRQLDGINALETTWSLEWTTRKEADIVSMTSYLAQQQGRSFPFLHPVSKIEYYVFCDEWDVSWDLRRRGDVYYGTLTAKFERAFGAQVEQAPSWVLKPGGYLPGVHVDFANEVMWDMINGTRGIDAGLTIARNSPATMQDPETGVWYSVAANALRRDVRGALIETARTNSVINSVIGGAVAGTPGTPPTSWSVFTGAGVVSSIVGTGVEDGIDYVDIRWVGTNTAGTTIALGISPTSLTVAAIGEAWTSSYFARLMAGNFSNITVASCGAVTWEATAAGAAQGGGIGWGLAQPNSSPLTSQRYRSTRVLDQVNTAKVFTQWRMHLNAGLAVDLTLRFGWPQLEKGSFASSPIKTTTVAVLRPQDDVSFSIATIFSPSEGTLFARGFINRTNTDTYGALAELNSGGTAAERYLIYINTGTLSSSASFYDNSVAQAGFLSPSPGTGAERRVAIGWKKNDFVYCANGVLQYDKSGTLGTAERIWFGKFGNGYAMDGFLTEVVYWRKRLTDAQIKSVANY